MTRYLFIIFAVLAAFPLHAGKWNGYAGTHFNYSRIKFDQSDPIDGYLWGVSTDLLYNYRNVMASVDFEGSWDTNYLRGDPDQKSSIEHYFLTARAGPCPLRCGKHLTVYPYAGFGWDRLINKQLPGRVSLCYRFDKLSIPLGLHVRYASGTAFESGFQVEWRPDVWSKLHLGSTKIDNKLCHAFRVQFPVKFTGCQPCPRGFISFVPFFNWNRYGRSDEENSFGASLGIPRLTKWDLGLHLLMGSNF